MRGGRVDDHGALVGGGPELDWQRQVETWHEGGHIHLGSSVPGCRGPDMDHPNLSPRLLDGLQLQLRLQPLMARGGNVE